MEEVFLICGSKTVKLSPAPQSFAALRSAVLEQFTLSCETFQYQDEEGDLITLASEQEYSEALSSSGTLTVTVPLSSASVLSVMPQCQSESESEKSGNSLVLISPEEPDFSVLLEETKEQALGTSCAKKDSGNETRSIPVVDAMTGVRTVDSGSDALLSLSKECGEKLYELNSVHSSTVPAEVQSSGFNTELQQDVSIGPSRADFSQQSELEHLPTVLLESMREIIREELGTSFGAAAAFKQSGILSKHPVACSGCAAFPVVGILYRCTLCESAFCESCEFTEEHPHPLRKLRKPAEERKAVKIDKSGAQYARPTSKEIFKKVEELTELGLTDQQRNLDALVKANYDVSRAAEILLDN